MPVNLLAICKQHGLIIKRVKVTAKVQSQLEGVFIQQEQIFVEGVNEEVAFDGGWNPEPNELLGIATTLPCAIWKTEDASGVSGAKRPGLAAIPVQNPLSKWPQMASGNCKGC